MAHQYQRSQKLVENRLCLIQTSRLLWKSQQCQWQKCFMYAIWKLAYMTVDLLTHCVCTEWHMCEKSQISIQDSIRPRLKTYVCETLMKTQFQTNSPWYDDMYRTGLWLWHTLSIGAPEIENRLISVFVQWWRSSRSAIFRTESNPWQPWHT